MKNVHYGEVVTFTRCSATSGITTAVVPWFFALTLSGSGSTLNFPTSVAFEKYGWQEYDFISPLSMSIAVTVN